MAEVPLIGALILFLQVANPQEPISTTLYLLRHNGPHEVMILRASLAWRVDPFVALALLRAESKLVPHAANRSTRAVGIAQLTPGGRLAVQRLRALRGLREAFGEHLARDPRHAIPAALELLAHQIARCGGIARGIAAYNAGRCVRPGPWVRYVLREAGRLRRRAGLRR